MYDTIKNWFVNAVANGGGLLLVAAIVLGGVGGAAVVTPVTGLFNGAPRDPVAQEPVNLNPDAWACPDASWAYHSGFAPDVGSTYATCSKNKVVMRHFDRVPINVKQDSFQDQGAYPFVDLDTLDEAIGIANSR